MHGRTLKKTPLPPGTGPSPPRPRALWPSAPRTATGDRRGGILETSGSEQSHSNAPTTRTSTATANIARRPLLHPGKLPQLEVPQPRVLHDPATFAFLAPRSSAQVEGVLLLECVVASDGPGRARRRPHGSYRPSSGRARVCLAPASQLHPRLHSPAGRDAECQLHCPWRGRALGRRAAAHDTGVAHNAEFRLTVGKEASVPHWAPAGGLKVAAEASL
mmetsp:Transcript_36667/g.121480  ORF Transcript_36667/g.121480 Transcript_36667/m.121480 type:complete len:218 (+) Transcript_36667:38-691(+)